MLVLGFITVRELRALVLWEERNVEASVDVASVSLQIAVSFIDPNLAQRVSDGLLSNENIYSVQVIDDFGRELASSTNMMEPGPASGIETILGFGKVLSVRHEIPVTEDKSGLLLVEASLGTAHRPRLASRFLLPALITAAFLVMIDTTLNHLAIRPLLGGLQRLHSWLPNLESKETAITVPPSLHFRELEELATRFQVMHGQISDQRTSLANSLKKVETQVELITQQGDILRQIMSISQVALLHFDSGDHFTSYSFDDAGMEMVKVMPQFRIHEASEFADEMNNNKRVTSTSILHMNDNRPGVLYELEVVNTDRQHYLITVVVLNDDGFAYLLTEITRSKALEAARTQLQKMESVGLLTSGVAHEFNNMLGVIISSLDLMQEEGLPIHYQPSLDMALAAGDRAAKTVSQLLRYARSDEFVDKVFNLKDRLIDLNLMLGKILGPEIDLTVSCPDGLFLNADPDRFDGVIVNLAINARDAMGGRGELTYNARLMEKEEVERDHFQLNRPYLVIEVSDTGSGIPPEIQNKIFDPFFSSKQPGKGTGLGLAEVYGFVTKVGGKISLDSTVGKGTTFHVIFPAERRKRPRNVPPPALTPSAQTAGLKQCRRVLIVDDEVGIRTTTARFLELRGFDVDTADGIVGATELLFSDPLSRPYDVLLCDLQLADGSGLDLARSAKLKFPDLMITIITGYIGAVPKEDLANFTVLEKPVRLSIVLDLLQTVPPQGS